MLLVDDRPETLSVLAQVLRSHGAMVWAVGSARAAVDCFATHDVDVVVSDVSMPGEDGVWLSARLHEMMAGARRQIPVIALTGHADDEAVERVLATSFAGHLTKPVGNEQLCLTVARFAERRGG